MNAKQKGRAKQLNLTRPNWYPRQCLHQYLCIMVTATVQESMCNVLVSFTVTKKYCTSETLCPESLDHDVLTCVQIWLCASRLCTCLPVYPLAKCMLACLCTVWLLQVHWVTRKTAPEQNIVP